MKIPLFYQTKFYFAQPRGGPGYQAMHNFVSLPYQDNKEVSYKNAVTWGTCTTSSKKETSTSVMRIIINYYSNILLQLRWLAANDSTCIPVDTEITE